MSSRSSPLHPSPRRPALCLRWLLMIVLTLLLGCRADLLHRLPEVEATQILAVLQEHGIEAEKQLDDEEANLWRVTVPRGEATRAFSLLAEYKLPRTSDRRMQDVFSQNKLVLSPVEEQALYLEALQGEIAHTLEAIEGVIDARVHLVRPQRDLAGRPLSQAKASVVIEYQPDAGGLQPIRPREVQALVANAVPDLQAEQVAVVQKASKLVRAEGEPRGEARGADLVTVGPLLLEASSLSSLRALVAAVLAVLFVLGFFLLRQMRRVDALRRELVSSRTGLESVESPS
ncbi:MAG: type III secretion inner membrane ring lipoprotein SctJ [Acidobacteriota bacterium]